MASLGLGWGGEDWVWVEGVSRTPPPPLGDDWKVGVFLALGKKWIFFKKKDTKKDTKSWVCA